MSEMPATVFNLWTFLFSGFSTLGIFYGIRLLGKSQNDIMQVILGIYIILQSITVLEYVFFWTNFYLQVPAICDISLLFPLLYGPLLLIYFDRSFGLIKPLQSYTIHFFPFIIFFILKIPFYLSSPDKKLYHILDIPLSGWFKYYEWIKIALLVAYCLVIFLRIHNQTGVGSMRMWAKSILGLFVVYILLVLGYKLIADNGMYTLQIDYAITAISCLSIGLIAWYGIGFPEIADGQDIVNSLFRASRNFAKIDDGPIPFANVRDPLLKVSMPLEPLEKYKNSGLPTSLALKLAEQLEALMMKDKLFSENDLSLNKLAEKLGTNKHFVSQMINQHFQMNFFDYVNLKRIEEAKRLLLSRTNTELNIIEIAYIVGFNNKGTFNAIFKKHTGTTPSKFRSHTS